MRISPAACAAVLKADPMALRADKIQLPVEFPHLTAGLGELFDQAASLEEAIPIFETRLADLRAEPDEIVVKAVGLICAASGSIRVGELAASLGISTRQLQRRFRQAGGISPKEFARIRRIRATASVIVDGEAVNWADRAIEMGYSDQSHLAHEFSSITGHSPVRFASKVRTIRHGKIVE
jgi:AraC-like DNA-binding protein